MFKLSRSVYGRALPLVVASAFAGQAGAASVYQAELTPVNEPNASGLATLTLDDNLLTIELSASGLAPSVVHPAHIHGRFDSGFDGTPIDSTVPRPPGFLSTTGDTLDDDGDGYLEVPEGQFAYGPIILPIVSPPGAVPAFPTTDADGNLSFT